jgi:hypothetical protein
MKIFNYSIDVYKTDTPESIRANKIKNFKLNATKGLIDAELQLLLSREQYTLAINEEEQDEAEKARLWEAIEFHAKSIRNYKAQLAVLNKQ